MARQPDTETSSPHRVEWWTGLASSLLVLAFVGWIVADMMRYRPEEPRFKVSVLSVERVGEAHRVLFNVANTSLSTAAQVHVRGSLAAGESADVTFDYVAAESAEKGALFFRGDPVSGLELAVVGYVEP